MKTTTAEDFNYNTGGSTIDRRTIAGKRLVKKIKEFNPKGENKLDIHPALTLLRVKDLIYFLNIGNLYIN